jgi:hypothetical protein
MTKVPFSSWNWDVTKDQSAYPGGFAGAEGARPEGQRVRQPELMTVRKSTWRRRVPR